MSTEVRKNESLPPTASLLLYVLAAVATVAATLLRFALIPLVGETSIPFITYFPAVLLLAWFGGFRRALLCLVLSVLAADYFFIAPPRTLLIASAADYVDWPKGPLPRTPRWSSSVLLIRGLRV